MMIALRLGLLRPYYDQQRRLLRVEVQFQSYGN